MNARIDRETFMVNVPCCGIVFVLVRKASAAGEKMPKVLLAFNHYAVCRMSEFSIASLYTTASVNRVALVASDAVCRNKSRMYLYVVGISILLQ